jgi:hypothetical protein
MNTYKVDIDYESYLFDPQYEENGKKYLNRIKEFEYIFFFINNELCNLKNYQNYSDEYLQSVLMLGGMIPNFNPNAIDYKYWWGKRENIEIERVINSKMTSSDFASKNNLGFFDGKIVNDETEIYQHISKFEHEQWILKNPFSFSGIGHKVFMKNERVSFKSSIPWLLEPFHKRLADFGITFELKEGKINNFFIVENLNTLNGSFKGGISAKDNNVFFNYFEKKYNFKLIKYFDVYEKICSHYTSLGARNYLQVDSFIYTENNEMKIYPLVEVNYRKTMGMLVHSLALKSKMPLIEWFFSNDFREDENSKLISPKTSKFKSYLREIEYC